MRFYSEWQKECYSRPCMRSRYYFLWSFWVVLALVPGNSYTKYWPEFCPNLRGLLCRLPESSLSMHCGLCPRSLQLPGDGVGSPCPQLPLPHSGRPPESKEALSSQLSPGTSPRQRHGTTLGLVSFLLHLRDHCPSLSDTQCLENDYFKYFVFYFYFFSCFIRKGKSGPVTPF